MSRTPSPDPTADAALDAVDGAEPPPRRFLRGLGFMVLLCTAIALFLTVLDGGGFGVKLVYSFAIGLSCWALIDGLRLGVELLRNAGRRRRGHTPAAGLGWLGLAPLVLLGVLAGPPLGMALGDLLLGQRSLHGWDLGSRAAQITLAITVLGTLVAMVVISALERSAAQRQRAEAAQRAAAEAQLRLLQSQLEPHMLFNTLANLRVLIGLDPARAQAMLDRLIAFLRSTLAASRAAAHPLADEFARLDDYLALMQVRMGPRLRVQLQLPADLAAQPVPPLLLQPLVENAIHHGLEPKVDGGWLRVTAERDGARLRLRVLDDGLGLAAGEAATRGTGFGLAQVRERLATRYGAAATLTLQAGPGGQGTCATLELPLTPGPPTP